MSEEQTPYKATEENKTVNVNEVLTQLAFMVNDIVEQLYNDPRVDKRWLHMASMDIDRGFLELLRAATITPDPTQNEDKSH